MSGLQALREAKKRSPDTIGILLAGPNKGDDLEAMVSDKEVFQIVRGEVSADSILELVESATKQARLLALGESANDTSSNFDEPITEEIVMETSENGSHIISDGTNRLPALQPQKIDISAEAGAREVDLMVLTRDEEFLATIRDSARGLHHMHHAVSPTQAEKFVRDHQVGVLITDAAIVDDGIEKLTEKLRKERPRLVAIVAGRRDDGEMLMDLINRGHVYRFLLKPVSPGRARLAIEASVKHHVEAPESAFKPKPPSRSSSRPVKAKPVSKSPTQSLAKAKPVAKPASTPVSKPVRKPAATPKPAAAKEDLPVLKAAPKAPPKPVARKVARSPAKPQPRPTARPVTPAASGKRSPPPKASPRKEKPARVEPTISATPVTEKLYGAIDAKRKQLAESVDKTLASAGSLASGAQDAVQASGEAVAGALAPLRKPKTIGIAAAVVLLAGGAAWLVSNWDDLSLPEIVPEPQPVAEESSASQSVPTIVETDIPFPLPAAQTPSDAQNEPPVYQALLEEARAASDAGNFIYPEGDNAIELYVAVLEEAPDDPAINEELAYVVDQVLRLAESALLEQNVEDAGDALAMARLADSENPRLAFLEAQLTQIQYRAALDEARIAIREGLFEDAALLISEARYLSGDNIEEIDLLSQELLDARSQQKVEEVLTLAAERLEAGDLISPTNNNARYYYELALSNDTDNQTAKQGLIIVASKLVLRARDAIDEARLDDASELIAYARALDPDSEDLAASSKALDAALAARAEAERQAEAARLAELERQAELARQAEAARQQELARQAELQRQAEEARLAELERQAEQARLAEIRRQQEEARQARVREAQQRDAENDAAVAATTSMLGVGGSTVREAAPISKPSAGSNASSAASNTAPARPKPLAPVEPTPEPTEQLVARDDLPTMTLPLRAGMSSEPPPSPTTVPISSLTRTNYVAPEYPRAAQRRNLSGSVDLVFTVSTVGNVKDVTVVSAEPDDTFNKAAIDAVSKWRFEPVIENGVALEKRSAVRLSFNLQ
ncbi:MAG: TonB family protein [Woeseiaceae bacterium]|nr:TonB family protein [Woeseiaceae bacterium]